MASHEVFGIEWVNPSADGKRAGYFRKIPRTRANPSAKQAQHRLAFSETSFEIFGMKGVEIQNDGRVISKNAVEIGRKLQGTGQPRKEMSLRERLLKLILER